MIWWSQHWHIWSKPLQYYIFPTTLKIFSTCYLSPLLQHTPKHVNHIFTCPALPSPGILNITPTLCSKQEAENLHSISSLTLSFQCSQSLVHFLLIIPRICLLSQYPPPNCKFRDFHPSHLEYCRVLDSGSYGENAVLIWYPQLKTLTELPGSEHLVRTLSVSLLWPCHNTLFPILTHFFLPCYWLTPSQPQDSLLLYFI